MPGIGTNPFSAGSIWKKALSTDVHRDALSKEYVTNLVRMVPQYYGAATITTGDYAVATYTAGSTTARVPVKFSNCQNNWASPPTGLMEQIGSVPIPSDAKPPTGTDHAMVIWQPSTDTVWELWRAEKRADGWYACWGGRISPASTSWGAFLPPYGVSASGLSLLAGIIRLDELQAGSINHAVGIALPEVRKGVFVWPAKRTDGRVDNPLAIPEGQRFQLDPSLDVETLPISRVAKMIAKAVQRYGMVVMDYGGVVGFGAEWERPFIDATGVNPYKALFEGKPNYKVLDGFPWNRLIALQA
jgi:hypothetical protein